MGGTYQTEFQMPAANCRPFFSDLLCDGFQCMEPFELQAVGATLECLRQVAGPKLDTMTIKATLKPNGQEAVQKLVDDFIKQPKDKPLQWK